MRLCVVKGCVEEIQPGSRRCAEHRALAIVRRADVTRPVFRRDGSLAYFEREWNWPDDVDADVLDLVRDTLAKVGEPVDTNGKPHFGWDTGFSATYEVAAQVLTGRVLADLPRALEGKLPKELTA